MAIGVALVGRGTSGGSSVATAGGSVTTGDTLVAIVSFDPGTTISSITDTAGNTYGAAKFALNAGGARGRLSAYVCENATGHASNVLTVNFSGSAFPVAHLVKITGAAAASYDSTATATNTTDTLSPYQVTSGSLAQAASALLCCAEINQTGATGAYSTSDFTLLSNENDASSFWSSMVGYSIVASTSAVTASMLKAGCAADNCSLGIMAFKEATAGGGAITGSIGQTLAVSGALRGTGALAGAVPTALAVAGTFSGTGAVVGALALALSLTGALTGRGALASAPTASLTVSGTLTDASAPRIGGHGIAYDFIADGGSDITTSTFTTEPTSYVLASVGRGTLTDHTSSSVSDNQGNGTYDQLGTRHAYTNWVNSGTALYAKQITSGGSGHAVIADKPDPSDEVTLLAVEARGVNAIIDHRWVEDLTSPNTSASVTVTGPAVLVSFWWGDNASGELLPAVSSGWALLDNTSSLASNHVQSASAYRVVSAAGTYSIDWTPSTSQGAQVYIVALQQVTALTGTISSTFAVAGGLTGSGRLIGSIPVSVTLSGQLAGIGAVTGSLAQAFSLTGALTGTGALVGVPSMALAVAGVLSGTGAMAGALSAAWSVTGALTGLGAGEMTGALSGAFALAGGLTGTGAMTGSAAETITVSGALIGSGALLGSLPSGFTVVGALTSIGSGEMAGVIAMPVLLVGQLIDATPSGITTAMAVAPATRWLATVAPRNGLVRARRAV